MKGIIFDMDGTMVDNMMTHHRAWQRKLASLGLEMPLEEVREKVHGVNTEILERLFGDRFTPAPSSCRSVKGRGSLMPPNGHARWRHPKS